jgi:hypothetical protein
MPLNYFLADGKAHAGPFVWAALSMKSLEGRENPVEVPLFKPDAVILNHDLELTISYGAPHLDDRLLAFFVKLQGIPDKVLEKLPHLRRIAIDNRKFCYHNFRAGVPDPDFQIGENLTHDFCKLDLHEGFGFRCDS